MTNTQTPELIDKLLSTEGRVELSPQDIREEQLSIAISHARNLSAADRLRLRSTLATWLERNQEQSADVQKEQIRTQAHTAITRLQESIGLTPTEQLTGRAVQARQKLEREWQTVRDPNVDRETRMKSGAKLLSMAGITALVGAPLIWSQWKGVFKSTDDEGENISFTRRIGRLLKALITTGAVVTGGVLLINGASHLENAVKHRRLDNADRARDTERSRSEAEQMPLADGARNFAVLPANTPLTGERALRGSLSISSQPNQPPIRFGIIEQGGEVLLRRGDDKAFRIRTPSNTPGSGYNVSEMITSMSVTPDHALKIEGQPKLPILSSLFQVSGIIRQEQLANLLSHAHEGKVEVTLEASTKQLSPLTRMLPIPTRNGISTLGTVVDGWLREQQQAGKARDLGDGQWQITVALNTEEVQSRSPSA